MNTKLSASGRPVVVAAEKITKNEIDKVTETGKEMLSKLAGDFDKADAAEFGLTEMEVSPEAIAVAEGLTDKASA